MRITQVVIGLLAAATAVASVQSPKLKIVVIGPPWKDAEVWEKLQKSATEVSEMKKRFPGEEYLVLEKGTDWLFLFDRAHPVLRHKVSKEMVLKAFLEHADSRGIVRFGALPKEIQDAALDLFTGAAISIRKMGSDAGNIEIALKIDLWIEAESEGRSVGISMSQPEDNARHKELIAELCEHGVPSYQMTQAEIEELNRLYAERARREYGLSVRYSGVHERGQGVATKTALDEFDKFLRDEEAELDGTYRKLQEQIQPDGLSAFGGRLPKEKIGRENLPAAVWSQYADAIRFNPKVYGFAIDADAERFLSSANSFRLRSVYIMYYADLPSRAAPGKPRQATLRAVELAIY